MKQEILDHWHASGTQEEDAAQAALSARVSDVIQEENQSSQR